ncbi:MAG TPA: hypothetical protein VFC39_10355 [Acidobacteriaceae bacterium]|nr:hypothetical protein [Acidobacteriaceae bacterium]
MSDRKIPAFASEAEEADWWFDNRKETAADLLKASREGRLRPSSLARRTQELRELANAESTQSEVLTSK